MVTSLKAYYYYLVYALRRLSGAPEGTEGFREWRSTILLLLVEIRFAFAIAFCIAPTLFESGTAIGWGILIGLPIAAATHHLLNDRVRYARYMAEFQSWSRRRRIVADTAAAAFSIFAVVSPLVARSLMTDMPWWR